MALKEDKEQSLSLWTDMITGEMSPMHLLQMFEQLH